MSSPSSKPSKAAAAGASGSSNKVWWIVGAGALLVGFALIAAVVANRSSSSSEATTTTPAGTDEAKAVVAKATSVPASVSDAVGADAVKGAPTPIDGEPLTKDGKPEVLYVGAEFCPYCAAQRWALLEALSRFGTFEDVGLTHSASNDVFPNTQTVSFHGSSYTSDYIAFTPVETASNVPDGNGSYEPLDTPTAEQAAIIQKYDEGGGIPFIDIANQYVFSGVTLDPQLLQGKTAAEIAKAMHDPNSDIAKGVLGSANLITATICQATEQKPADVCNAPGVQQFAKGFAKS